MARPETSKEDRSLWTLVGPLVGAQRRRLSLMSAAAIIGGFAEAATLVLIAQIAFALTTDKSSVTVDFGPIPKTEVPMSAVIGITIGVIVFRGLLQYLQMVLAARATFFTVNRVRRRLINLYLGAGWPLQAAQREGRLQELLTRYAGATAGSVNALTQCGIASFNLLALLVTALAVNAIASVSAAVFALLMGLALRPLRAAVRRRAGRTAQADLEFATGLTELASTLQEVRIFNVERAVGTRLGSLADTASDRALHQGYLSGSIGVIFQSSAMLLVVGALSVAYAAGVSGIASLGAVVLVMIRSLSYAQAIQGSVQGLHEAAPYLETLRDEENGYLAAAIRRDGAPVDFIGDITFQDVYYAYKPGENVLRNVSFHVRHGEIIGIVGPSGSGKSTLVQLLLRLREPTAGAVLVGGKDARELSLADWYGRVTVVPQEPRLFAGTVAANIRFFRDDIDMAAIERAAKLANLHDDIESWPLGYDTPVGERGGQLSGGQRQRLCIARALVEGPDIMVLDEPTSSLDVKSESLIRETLAHLAPDATVFVVAHRLSTLAICDRIMVILGGELEGFDRSDVLEATNPFYSEALRLSGMR